MAYPDGHVGWLVTGHAQARAVLADPRFSSRYELLHFPLPGFEELGALPPAPVGDMSGVDAPEHTRYRRLLAGKFTVRRMRLLTERTERIAADHLDALRRGGPTADLVRDYAQPVPAVVICELLGVPYADRDSFAGHAVTVTDVEAPLADRGAAYTALQEYVAGLVRTKRAAPTDDVLSDLTGTDLTDEELAGVGTFLLGAGLDTTANMIALGTFALLRHPDQLDVLRTDPSSVDSAVEELMRYLSIPHTGVRSALVDVELDGRLIAAGETVTLSLQAANRDPLRFPDPDALDLRRNAAGHLSFGHGAHQCLGQQLARVEMRVAFPALLRGLPSLRLAVPAEDVPLRPDHQGIHGVRRLPVSWDEP
ncbi:cytochrome P450 [Actinokineospora bangkokensis]|uniref:Cytochrome n=1 Tax=Actinokineospora bangkokensis TaxID=1193682 RepID=A0A1Q9LML7_9PSEU|nr:cytochrome [Actinokineospora bangkokensis]